ncbi:MAG: hypothetical protein FWD35_05100 [Oscillospiraceae bacterium]|nr:hypothetical protein [Oscillospiraceae bacterium]
MALTREQIKRLQLSDEWVTEIARYHREIDELTENGFLDQLMGVHLPNTEEETDEMKWLEGSIRFAEANRHLLFPNSVAQGSR